MIRNADGVHHHPEPVFPDVGMRQSIVVKIGPELIIDRNEMAVKLFRRGNADLRKPEYVVQFKNRFRRISIKIPQCMVEIEKKMFIHG